MRTLTRHLLSQQLWLFAGALVVFFAIGAVAEILGHLGEIVDRRPGFGGALRALALRVSARYAGDAVPAASFAAVFLCLGLAGRRGELQGLHSCGLASRQLSVPLLVTAGALSWATLLIDQTWLLDAPRALSDPPPAATTRSGGGPIWYHSGQTIYNAARRDADGSLRDLAIFELDDRGRVVAATHVGVVPSDAQDWELVSAVRTRFDPADPLWSATDEVGAVALPLHAASSMTGAPGLTASIARGPQAGAQAHSQRVARHSHLAQAASVLVCALLALPLALGIGPGASLARPALVGAALLSVYLGLGAVCELASTRAWLPVWLGAWLSPALLSVAAVVALVRARI